MHHFALLDRSLAFLFAPNRCSFPIMPKQVWPRKNEAVLEPEVVMYAFIAFSALFPTTQSRKRGRDAAEPVNLAAHPNVSAFFGTQPSNWVDIASAMSTHPLTKELPHLHSSAGLNSWFAKYRPKLKFSSAFRDAHCSQRWKQIRSKQPFYG